MPPSVPPVSSPLLSSPFFSRSRAHARVISLVTEIVSVVRGVLPSPSLSHLSLSFSRRRGEPLRLSSRLLATEFTSVAR